jgi:hypothetical protein
MKKYIIFVIVLLLLAPSAFALQCKDGNYGSDECWTTVRIDPGYGTLVSRGHILVVSVAGKTVADNDGFLAQLAGSSADKVLGVAQNSIASGEMSRVLTKGRGVVKTDGASSTIASGDQLSNSASGSAVEASVATGVNSAKAKVGIALEAQSGQTTESSGKARTIYAYIDTM